MKKTLTVKEWNRICLQEMVLKGLLVFTKDGYKPTKLFYKVMAEDLDYDIEAEKMVKWCQSVTEKEFARNVGKKLKEAENSLNGKNYK